MRRLYLLGEIGEVTYAEGEYNHPMDDISSLKLARVDIIGGTGFPPTYYNTHALAPLMYITDTMPIKSEWSIYCYSKENKLSMRVREVLVLLFFAE